MNYCTAERFGSMPCHDSRCERHTVVKVRKAVGSNNVRVDAHGTVIYLSPAEARLVASSLMELAR